MRLNGLDGRLRMLDRLNACTKLIVKERSQTNNLQRSSEISVRYCSYAVLVHRSIYLLTHIKRC